MLASSRISTFLAILRKVLDGVVITEAEAEAISHEEKTELIRRDPVVCTLYF